MGWRLKGIIQKGLSILPGGETLNDSAQKRFGGLRDFERNIAAKVNDWKLSMRYLQEVDFKVRGTTLVEIGTGWYPTLPVCFRLAGVKRLLTYDVVRHMDSALTVRMINALESHLDSIAETCGARPEEMRESYHGLRKANDLGELLTLAGVEYRAPADARATLLPSESVDLVFSNSVMQHIPKEVIFRIMHENKRILRPGGLALHNVGCNDHYAFADRGISFVNYLQYSEPQWRKWNNSLQYQNRLRASEFLNLAADVGLEVIYKRTAIRPGTYEALSTHQIAAEFERFSKEDLAITTVDFVARKPTK